MNTAIISQNNMDTSVLDSMFGTDATDVITVEDTKTNDLTNTSVGKVLDAVTNPKPETVEEKKSVITNEKEGTNVLDTLTTEESKPIPDTEETPVVEEVGTDKGRPKTDKSALIGYLKSKIESQEFGVSDEFDATKITIDDYLSKMAEKDLYSLLDSNMKAKEEEIRNQTPQDFYEALPDEAKAVAEYAAKGGTDWKAFYSAMGRVEEVKQLDPNNEDHHPLIVRSYLQATTKLNPDQINEQIEDYKATDKLGKKALEFKVPLDALQKEQADAYLKQADTQTKQRQELAEFYAQNVANTLSTNELAGVKLDKKFARELEHNMVTNVPGPWSGKSVNYLGYGLEKAQFVEPDYEAVMLAAWILNDKPAALKALGQRGANEEVEKTIKLIKMDQGIKAASVALVEQKPVRKLNKMSNSNDLKRSTY